MANAQVGSVSIELEARLAKFESDMGRASRIAEKEMEKMRRQVSGAIGKIENQLSGFSSKVGNVFTGMLAGLSVGALTAFGKGLIDTADNINDMSKKFGIGTQALSVWRLAAEKSGTSLDGIARGAKILSKDLADSEVKLKSMGISLRDTSGKVKPMETVMEEIAKKFAGYEDGVEKAALATALFGKAGADLIPFFDDFGSGVDTAKERAKQFGVIIGPDFAAAADQFNDNARDMKAAAEGFGIGVLTVVLPAINQFTGAQLDAAAKSGGFVSAGEKVGEVLKSVALGLVFAKNAVDTFADVLIWIGKVSIAQFTAMGTAAKSFFDFFSNSFSAYLDALVNPLKIVDSFKTIKAQSALLYSGLAEAAKDALKDVDHANDDFAASFTANVQDAGDAMDAFLPGAAAINKVKEAAKGAAPAVKTLADAEKAAAEAMRLWTQAQKQHDNEMMKDEEIIIKLRKATDDYNKAVAATTHGLENDIKLAGLSGEARQALENHLKAETIARKELADSMDTTHRMSDQEYQDRVRQVEGLLNTIDATKKATAEAEKYHQAWLQALDSIGQAFGNFVAGGFKDWKGFLNSMKQAFAKWIGDIITQMVQSNLKNAFGSLFGGGSATSGESGGGFAAAFSRIIGNSGSGYTGGSTYGTPGFVGPPGPNDTPVTGAGATAGSRLGAVVGGAVAAYAGWQNAAHGGSPLATVGSFTMAGAQIGSMLGPIGAAWGAVIGAIVGVLVAIFKKASPPDVRIGGAAGDVRKPEGTFQTAFGTVQIGTRATDQTPVREAVQKFDAAIAGMIGPIQGGAAQILKISAALNTWAVDLKGDADNVDNLLGLRFDRILSTFDTDVQDFVNGADKLEDKVQRLGDAFAAEATFSSLNLDVTFKQFLDIVDAVQILGETSSATMQRVIGSTQLFGDALKFMHVQIDKSGADFVQFAIDIASAAGGLDAAKKLWDGFLNRFYSPVEAAQTGTDATRATAVAAFAAIGQDVLPTMEAFRAQFEALIPTLTPEQIVAYLTAGNALADLTDAERSLAAIRETAAAATDAYANAVSDINAELNRVQGGWQPGNLAGALSQVRAEEAATIAQLNKLAIAAGMASASESDLATVHQISAIKAAQAIAALKAAAQSLIDQLYGPQLAGTSSDALTAQQTLDQAAQQMFDSWQSAIEGIKKWLDDILLNPALTTLTPQQQLAAAQAQFDAAQAAAMGGDANAAAQLPGLASILLEKARAFWASGDSYDAIFRAVMAAMQGVTGAAGPAPPATQTQIDAATAAAEQAAADVLEQRRLMAVELAGYMRDLADALGVSIFQLADDMGVHLNQFVADLGVNTSAMTVAMAEQLAGVAQMLGVELPDLADQLGLSLGMITDANSLMNDALEAAIAAQPVEVAARLEPLLHAVETATTTADANAAIHALELAVNDVGGATAVALAPYLGGVDPPSMADQIAALQHIDNASATYLPSIDAWLAAIAASLGAQPDVPQFAQGSANIPYDQLAMVHAGEKVIDAKTSAMLNQYGIRVSAPSGGDDETKRLLREVLQRTQAREDKQVQLQERMLAALDKLATTNDRRVR